jgi:hypothetical protein
MSWALLAELAEREEVAVAGHRWDELLAIQDERRDLLAGLQRPLPLEARPVLERALARSQATEQFLVGSLVEAKGAIARISQGRRAIGAYGAGSGTRVDTRG